MKLAYEGYDMAGKPAAGFVEAAGVAEAAEHLRRQGLFVTSVREQSAVTADPVPGAPRARRTGARSRDMVAFFRQLSILVGTHTPLVQALDAIERQTPDGPWRSVVADLRRRVEEGAALSAAMEAHASRFDAICRSMVAAGESGGRLDIMLRGLAEMVRQQYHVRRSVLGAMVYPAVLIVVSLCVLLVTLFFVLPQFRGLFDTLQVPLPPTTALLMSTSDWCASHWWAVIALAIAVATAPVIALRSPPVRECLDRILVVAPRIGPIVRAFATARIARVMGVLLDARIPMLDAVRLARQGCSNSCYARLLDRAESAITRGESLADTLSHSGLVVPSICEALASGERSGELGPVLLQVASFLDEDNEVLIKALMSIIEPIILTFLGVIIGFVAVSMFLPLFDIATLGGQASQ